MPKHPSLNELLQYSLRKLIASDTTKFLLMSKYNGRTFVRLNTIPGALDYINRTIKEDNNWIDFAYRPCDWDITIIYSLYLIHLNGSYLNVSRELEKIYDQLSSTDKAIIEIRNTSNEF